MNLFLRGTKKKNLADPPRRRRGGQCNQSVVSVPVSMSVTMSMSMTPSAGVGAIAAMGRAKGFEKLGGAEGPDLRLFVVLAR